MYTKRVEEHLEAVLPKQGYAVDSVTYTKEMGVNYLRAFIYRTDGVDMTVNDCANVSRPLSKWLDKEDFIPEEYMLEVCSLGFKENPGNEDIEVKDEDALSSLEEGGDGIEEAGTED